MHLQSQLESNTISDEEKHKILMEELGELAYEQPLTAFFILQRYSQYCDQNVINKLYNCLNWYVIRHFEEKHINQDNFWAPLLYDLYVNRNAQHGSSWEEEKYECLENRIKSWNDICIPKFSKNYNEISIEFLKKIQRNVREYLEHKRIKRSLKKPQKIRLNFNHPISELQASYYACGGGYYPRGYRFAKMLIKFDRAEFKRKYYTIPNKSKNKSNNNWMNRSMNISNNPDPDPNHVMWETFGLKSEEKQPSSSNDNDNKNWIELWKECGLNTEKLI